MNWEKRKLIPKPTHPGVHRLYNDHQVDLLSDLVEASGSPPEFTEASAQLWKLWDQHG